MDHGALEPGLSCVTSSSGPRQPPALPADSTPQGNNIWTTEFDPAGSPWAGRLSSSAWTRTGTCAHTLTYVLSMLGVQGRTYYILEQICFTLWKTKYSLFVGSVLSECISSLYCFVDCNSLISSDVYSLTLHLSVVSFYLWVFCFVFLIQTNNWSFGLKHRISWLTSFWRRLVNVEASSVEVCYSNSPS